MQGTKDRHELQHLPHVRRQSVCMFLLLERQCINATRTSFKVVTEMVSYPGWQGGVSPCRLLEQVFITKT